MPAGLQYRDTVNYENMDLGGMGATAERALQSGSGVLNTLIEGGMSTLSSGLTGAGGKDLACRGYNETCIKFTSDRNCGCV